MNVDYQFRTQKHSKFLIEYAEKRLSKFAKYASSNMEMTVYFETISTYRRTVTIRAVNGKQYLEATSETDDFFEAIDLVTDKLVNQLSKIEGKRKKMKLKNQVYTKNIFNLNEKRTRDYEKEQEEWDWELIA